MIYLISIGGVWRLATIAPATAYSGSEDDPSIWSEVGTTAELGRVGQQTYCLPVGDAENPTPAFNGTIAAVRQADAMEHIAASLEPVGRLANGLADILTEVALRELFEELAPQMGLYKDSDGIWRKRGHRL